jgi:uncharacterized membrane protein
MSNVPPPPGVPGQPQLDVGDAVSYAWKKFQQYAGPLILIVLIVVIVNLVGAILRFTIDSFIVGALVAVLFWIVGQIVTIGVINASLMVTRGETPEPGKAFNTEYLGPFIIGSILYGLIVLIGLILCIIPGIIAAFMLSFYGFYILDRGLSATDALTASFNMVKDNFGKVFLVILVAFVINFIGAILCGIGLLVTAPLCWIILAYAYRKLNNEPVAP